MSSEQENRFDGEDQEQNLFFNEVDRRKIEDLMGTFDNDQWMLFIETELGREIISKARTQRKEEILLLVVSKLLKSFESRDQCLQALVMAEMMENHETPKMPIRYFNPTLLYDLEDIYKRMLRLGTTVQFFAKISRLDKLAAVQCTYLKREAFSDRVAVLEKRLGPKLMKKRAAIRADIERLVELQDISRIRFTSTKEQYEFNMLTARFADNNEEYLTVFLDEASNIG